AILSDIHSNLAALEAVLADLKARGGADQLWCLGDIVGYGPDPGECLELLRWQDHICVAGNHDWGAAGKVDLETFNPDAAAACLWNAQRLTEEQLRYLDGLPLELQASDFTLVHGSPRDPIWEYLLSEPAAWESFQRLGTRCCLIGHSHIPLFFEAMPEEEIARQRELPEGVALQLGERRLIINPGSVGQPRDGNPKASYALYDAEAGLLWHYRVPYDMAVTQEKMMKEHLPPRLAARLSYGR
ncbi:MAG: metallophosphoesterase family protein, partial [Chloroflexota bacterium]|nr:metallophosphoesterase family protein [Chloroflexota bacterium]